MTGKEMLEALQTFSEESLNKEICIWGADCMFYYPGGLSILDEDRYDEEREKTIPKGSIVIDW